MIFIMKLLLNRLLDT